jgi:hypothetical protein
MSGLLSRSHMNAGQDGFRDGSSKQVCDLGRPLPLPDYLLSGIDRSLHLPFARKFWHRLSRVAVKRPPGLADL